MQGQMFQKPHRVRDRQLIEWLSQFSCVACGKRPVDVDHIKTRGSGGDDAAFNLWPLCREHHAMKHSQGLLRFAFLFPRCRQYLKDNGWAIDTLKNTYVHPRYEDVSTEGVPTPEV